MTSSIISESVKSVLEAYNIDAFYKILIDSISELQFNTLIINKLQSLKLCGSKFTQFSPNTFAELLQNKCDITSINAKQIYQNILSKIQNIKNDFINDPNWTQFNAQYKYNTVISCTHTQTIWKIQNINALCFKESIIKSNDDLYKVINEYNAIKKYYKAHYNTNEMIKLYINKTKSKTKTRLIMKHFEGEDLDDFLVDEDDNEVGFLFENDFRIIMKKILNKLNILHNNYMLHCDIKPANIRINENSDKYVENDANYYDVNIVDFAYVEICQNMNKAIILNHIKGTPGFIAPEIIKNKKYSIKSDIFSIGCVAFFLLTNQYAVIQSNSMNIKDMMPDRKRLKSILKRENDRNRDNESRIHKKTIDFVLNCLWRNPVKRPSTQEALDNEIFQNV